jgi:hypothetical protein
MVRKLVVAGFLIALFVSPCLGTPAKTARGTVIEIVAQIQRSDYEGDRAALERLYGELTSFVDNAELASRVHYWRGFALWRRTINGFNESADPKELQSDLERATSEFRETWTLDPRFVDAKIGAASCLSNLVFLNRQNPQRVRNYLVSRGRC